MAINKDVYGKFKNYSKLNRKMMRYALKEIMSQNKFILLINKNINL